MTPTDQIQADSSRGKKQALTAKFYRALVATSWISGAFCAVICLVILYNHLTASTNDPWKSPQLIALKEKLLVEPRNDALKKEIRHLDSEFRQHYRRRLTLNGLGGWLMLAGALVLVVSARQANELKKKAPMPKPNPNVAEERMKLSARARWSVATASVVVVVGLLSLSAFISSALPRTPAGWERLLGADDADTGTAASDQPSLVEMQANWPRFRGWDGSGVVTSTNPAFSLGAPGSLNVVWKSPVLALGHSSPIIWSNRLCISGGSADKREVFCYDVSKGELLWRRVIENVPGSPATIPEVPEETSYAASTMATDGRRVYVFFANGDLAALTFDGTVAWSKAYGPLKNSYGHATSLAVWPGRLILQLDQGESGSSLSKLIALDPATGRVAWEKSRPVPASWASPIIVEAAGKTQIVTLANPWIIVYALADGTELWRAELMEGEVVPSPVYAGGFVLVENPSSKLIALRPDGAGDVTKTHVAWSTDENVPDIPSPIGNGELAFCVTSSGLLTCYDAKSGKKIWEHDLKMDEVQASPGLVGDRVFVLSTKGEAAVVEASREFKEIGRTQWIDKFQASPAFANGRIYLRGVTNLWCIGTAKLQ